MNITDVVSDFQRTSLEQTTTAQKRIVEFNKSMAEIAHKSFPVLPNMPEVPGMENLSGLNEVVSTSFDFASELFEANRKFMTDLVEVWIPAADTKPKAAAKTS